MPIAEAIVGFALAYAAERGLDAASERLGGGPAQRERAALDRAVGRALARFQTEHPELADLFDRTFVQERAGSQLARLLTRSGHADPATLAEAFADYLPGRSADKFTPACRSFLRMLEEEMSGDRDLRELVTARGVDELVARAQAAPARPPSTAFAAASGEHVAGWAKTAGMQENAGLIELRLTEPPRGGQDPHGRTIPREVILEQLKDGERLVLAAGPGAGKTTTLLQIARALAGQGGRLPLIVRLPAWAENPHHNAVGHLAASGPFQARGISVRDLAERAASEGVFLLDGWNEVAPSRIQAMAERLTDLAAGYPTAGILVTSRSVAVPALSAAKVVDLARLSGQQRRGVGAGS